MRSSQQKKLLKSRHGTPLAGTPTASRAASPAPPAALPTLEEVKAAIPEEGIALSQLVAIFKKRVPGKEATSFFIGLVKQAGTQDRETKLIKPKGT